MSDREHLPPLSEWFASNGLQNITPISKSSPETSAWFAFTSNGEMFLKLYPSSLTETWVATEIAIAGANLHPAIAPLQRTIACQEGIVLIYPRVAGENLGPSDTRAKFQSLPIPERIRAVTTVIEALSAIAEAGFMIVDWYEGNMIYDFAQKQIWLFDWDLCRPGDGFTLEMDSNYGSSRLMAPEEFVRGSQLDQRTIVFNLGRYVLLVLPELAVSLAPVLAKATYPAPSERYSSVRKFAQDFAQAIL